MSQEKSTTVFANTNRPPTPSYVSGVSGGTTPEDMIAMHLLSVVPMTPSTADHDGVTGEATSLLQSEFQGVVQSTSVFTLHTARIIAGFLNDAIRFLEDKGRR